MALSPYNHQHALELYYAGKYEDLYTYCNLYKRKYLPALTMFSVACDLTGKLKERDISYQKKLNILQKNLNHGPDPGRTCHSIANLYGIDNTPLYDPVSEFQYLEKAYCNYGYTPALWEYLQHLIHGIGCSPDIKKAVQLMQDATYINPDLEVYLGIFYDYGIGLQQNRKKAFAIYQKHLNCKEKKLSDIAHLCLAICYYHGAGTDQNFEKALQLFQTVSDDIIAEMYIAILTEKRPDAFYKLGCAFILGGIDCIECDPTRGFAMLETAYTLSQSEPYCSALGACYLMGCGCQQNFDKAKLLFEEGGSDAAQVCLGVMAYNGCGQPINYIKSVRAFQQGANQGNSIAIYYLAICYLEGKAVQKSHSEAKKILERHSVSGFDAGSLNCKGLKALLILENPSSFDEKKEALHEIQILANLAPPWREWGELLAKDLTPNSISILIDLFCRAIKYSDTHGNPNYRPLSISRLSFMASSALSSYSVAKDYATNNSIEKNTRNQLLIAEQNSDQIKTSQKKLDSIQQSLIRVESQLDAIQSHIVEFKQQAEKMLSTFETIQEQELYISQKSQQTSELLYQDICQQFVPNVSQERKRLQKQFGPCWDKLLAQSQNALVSAAVLWHTCSSINDAGFDFSGICITATSALENELCKYFFTDLKAFLDKKFANESNPYQYWPDVLLCKYKDDLFPKETFSIGLLPYLFAFHDKLTYNVKHLPVREEKKLLLKIMQEYLGTVLDVPDGISPCSLFCEARGSTKSFVARCETVRQKYRNPAAHRGVITKSDASRCYFEIVGREEAARDQEIIKGLLIELLSLIR